MIVNKKMTGESNLQQDSTPSNCAKNVRDLHNNSTLPFFFNDYSHPIPLTTLFKMTCAKTIPKCCKMISSPACLDIPSQTLVHTRLNRLVVQASVFICHDCCLLATRKGDCPSTSKKSFTTSTFFFMAKLWASVSEPTTQSQKRKVDKL